MTNHNDGLTLSRRLGARVGAVTPEALEEFLQHDPTDADELVYQGPPPAEAVRRLAARRHVRLRSFTEFQGMLDLGDYVDGRPHACAPTPTTHRTSTCRSATGTCAATTRASARTSPPG